MKTTALVLAIGVVGWLAACDDSTPGGDGGCAAALCSGVCCAPTDSCIQLACCSAEQSCGDSCCTPGAICVSDGSGGKKCDTVCTTNAACPSTAPCCTPSPSGKGTCAAAATGQQCLCTSGFDCTTKCCAPATDSSGNPVGPYICKPNDGADYNCVNGAGLCAGPGCKASDPHGGYICIKHCTVGGSECGGGSQCTSYTLPSDTNCIDQYGCGP